MERGREMEGEGMRRGRGGRKGRGEGKRKGHSNPLKKVWLRACITLPAGNGHRGRTLNVTA